MDIAALRQSIDIEARADLMAAALRFGEAASLMKEVNAIRRQQFGSISDPNELRELTGNAIADSLGMLSNRRP